MQCFTSKAKVNCHAPQQRKASCSQLRTPHERCRLPVQRAGGEAACAGTCQLVAVAGVHASRQRLPWTAACRMLNPCTFTISTAAGEDE